MLRMLFSVMGFSAQETWTPEKVQHRARKMINEVEDLSYKEVLDNLLHCPWFPVGSCGLLHQLCVWFYLKSVPPERPAYIPLLKTEITDSFVFRSVSFKLEKMKLVKYKIKSQPPQAYISLNLRVQEFSQGLEARKGNLIWKHFRTCIL